MLHTTIASPVGKLLLLGDGHFLTGLYMERQTYGPTRQPTWREDRSVFRRVIEQLAAYFAGELRDFDVPLKPHGTEFQRRTWHALTQIPYGATENYGALARRIGMPKAARAVGMANGRNPIGIIVPCHRVIGADGSLTGYGGGIERKRCLLEHEARHALGSIETRGSSSPAFRSPDALHGGSLR